MSPGLVTFLVLAFFRVLRIPAPGFFPFGFTRPRRLDLVEFAALPRHIRDRWEEPLAEFEAGGLQIAFVYSLPTVGSLKEAFGIILRSDDGRLHGSLSYLRNQVGAHNKELVAATVSSRLADDRRIATSNTRSFLNQPPEYQVRSMPELSAGEVLTRHLERVASSGWTPLAIAADELPDVIIHNDQRHIDFQIERGVPAPMTGSEARRLSRMFGSGPPEPATRLSRIDGFLDKLEWIGMSALIPWMVLILSARIDTRPGDATQPVVTFGFLGAVFALKAARFGLKQFDRPRTEPAAEEQAR